MLLDEKRVLCRVYCKKIRCYLNRIILAIMQLGAFAAANVLSVLKLRDYRDNGLHGRDAV